MKKKKPDLIHLLNSSRWGLYKISLEMTEMNILNFVFILILPLFRNKYKKTQAIKLSKINYKSTMHIVHNVCFNPNLKHTE